MGRWSTDEEQQILEISVAIIRYSTYIPRSFYLGTEAISGHADEYSNKHLRRITGVPPLSLLQ
jgi:hypothetical protein